MPFNKNRNSRDDKSGKESKRSDRSEFSGRPKSENRPFHSSSSFKKKDDPGFNSDRKSYGDKKENSGDRKPYSSKEGGSFRDKKPYGTREGSSYGNKKPYGTLSEGSGDRKPYGSRNEDAEKSRPFDKKEGGSYRDKKAYGDKREHFGERKAYLDSGKSFDGERKSYGDRKEGFSDRKPYGDKREGDRKPFVSSDKSFGGESRPFDKKEGGYDRSESAGKTYRKRAGKPADISEFNDEQVTLRTKTNAPKGFKKESETIRLNRFISNAGICSRRKADELIEAGVITVNGEAVSELGTKVNPSKDEIRYNGELLKREKMVYVLLNKPKDYITTTDDPQERKTVMELVEKASRERIYPVGRLDRNTTGLLLLTNDGDLADKLSHPKNSISKIYNIELDRNLTQGDFNKIAFGVELEDGFIKPDDLRYVTGGAKNEIGIQIHSGKNRIVRRIFESLGYEVMKLDRVIYANLTKKDLTRGRWRYLTDQEIVQLKHFTKI